MYNVDWVHDEIFQWSIGGARNHNPCVHFAPDIDPTKLQLFQMFFFEDIIEGFLLHGINDRIEGKKFPYGKFPVFVRVWLKVATIQGP